MFLAMWHKKKKIPAKTQKTPSNDVNASKLSVFCDKERKFFKGYWKTLQVRVTTDPMKSIAQEMKDNILLAKINDLSEKNQTIFYDKLCK